VRSIYLLGLAAASIAAASLAGCQSAPKPSPVKSSTVPTSVYALVGNEGGLGDFRKASKAEIEKYLDDQAQQSQVTDAHQLYACTLKDRVPIIPVFTTADHAKQFVNRIFHNHLRDKRPPSVIAMSMVEMNDAALYDRTSTRTDVQIIDIDPTFPTERRVKPMDLIQTTQALSPSAITDRQVVWVSIKGSNVDKAR